MPSTHDTEAEAFELEPEADDELDDELDEFDTAVLDELDEFETDGLGELDAFELAGAEGEAGAAPRRRTHPDLGVVLSLPRAQAARELGAPDPEVIPPDDTRAPVMDTTAVPYRWICWLDLNFGPDPTSPGNDIVGRGTGTLISPRHVLTAGHNLRNVFNGSPAAIDIRTARVAPGFSVLGKRGDIFGMARGARFDVHANWRASRNRQFDYGLITLDTAIGNRAQSALGGKPLGFWGSRDHGAGTRITPLAAADVARLRGTLTNLSGYPGDKCGLRADDGTCRASLWATAQFRATGRVTDPAPAAAPRAFFHDADTFGGHSGSPIWTRFQQFRNLVAVHTGPASVFDPALSRVANRGVRVTAEVMEQVRAWMRA